VDGLWAIDDVTIGPVQAKQFKFLYANKIISDTFTDGDDGVVGLSPLSSNWGDNLIQEVIKYC
jgi:hypothetical protein